MAVLLIRIDHVSYHLGHVILAPNRSPRALRLVATLSRHSKGKGEGTRGYLHPSSVLHVRFHSPALTGTEVSKGARYEVGSAVGLHGINSEVIGCPRLKVIKAYTEYRRCVIRVQPDRGFGCLGQAMGVCAVVHDSVMHGGAAGIVRCPIDNRQILPRQLDLRPLNDP